MTVKITAKFTDRSREVTARLVATFQKIMNEMEADANRFVPVDTGLLRSTIVLERKSPTEFILPARTPYAAAVEFGSKPHFVSGEKLKGWSKRVLGDEGAAYAVAAGIAKKGTPKQPYMRPALDIAEIKIKNMLALSELFGE